MSFKIKFKKVGEKKSDSAVFVSYEITAIHHAGNVIIDKMPPIKGRLQINQMQDRIAQHVGNVVVITGWRRMET